MNGDAGSCWRAPRRLGQAHALRSVGRGPCAIMIEHCPQGTAPPADELSKVSAELPELQQDLQASGDSSCPARRPLVPAIGEHAGADFSPQEKKCLDIQCVDDMIGLSTCDNGEG